jgi:P22 coat protein - gene protein 5
MSATLLSDVSNQVATFWSDMFMDELKETSLLAGLVNKDYEGELTNKPGKTVRVSQINRPEATRKTVGSGHEFFGTSKLSTSYVDITADQVISAALEFDDLVDLQSQIGQQDSKIRQSLLEAVDIELNNYLYSKISPSTSSPDHLISGVSDYNASAIAADRKRAAQAKWKKEGGWWVLADPSYYSDLLNATTLQSSDYVGPEAAIVAGQMVRQRFGFNILEDNSAGLITAMNRLGSSTGTEDAGLVFHKDFMHLVMPKVAEFKVSDLHSNKQFGYIISVKIVVGAALGIDGSKKHIVVYNS